MNGGWRRVWEERGALYPDDDPTRLDGWDQPFSKLTPWAVSDITDYLLEALSPNTDDHILEVGCGAGLLLRMLAPHARTVGVDLAATMLDRARSLWPAIRCLQAEALRLPFRSNLFSGVFTHSVFQYFPDHEYAQGALLEMCRVLSPGGRLVVAGVQDVKLREAHLAARSAAAANQPPPSWRSSVTTDLDQLYYSRDFFREWATQHGVDVAFRVREVPDHLNAQFQFDATLAV